MNKQAKQDLTLPIIVGAILIFIIFTSGLIPIIQIFGPDLFVKPSWARLECLPTDAFEGGYSRLLTQQTIFKCDGFTEECEFAVEHTTTGAFILSLRTKYRNCNLIGGDCSSWMNFHLDDGERGTLPKIDVERQYEFDISGLNIGEQYGEVSIEWKPWRLYRLVGAKKDIINSQNCDITSAAKSKIREEELVIELFRHGGPGVKWINYVDGWFYGPGTNIVTYQGKEAYCTAGEVFDIVKLEMADGSLRKLDPTYVGTLDTGEILRGQGTRIDIVQCCPSEAICGDDFKFLTAPEEDVECFTDSQCFNAGGPVPKTGKSYVTWSCSSEGKCIESDPITVECTTNAQCVGNKICDLSTMNYGKCILQITGEPIIKEEVNSLDAMFGWAALFDITGDGKKDGSDGLIIIIIGVVLLFLLFQIGGQRRGQRRF